MRKEEIVKLNMVELKKKAKTQAISTAILVLLVITMFVIAFVIKPETSKVLPFAFLPLMVINLMNSRRFSKELKSRENQ